ALHGTAALHHAAHAGYGGAEVERAFDDDGLVGIYLDVEDPASSQRIVGDQRVALPGGNGHAGLADQRATAEVADSDGGGRLADGVERGNEGVEAGQGFAIGKGEMHGGLRLADDVG